MSAERSAFSAKFGGALNNLAGIMIAFPPRAVECKSEISQTTAAAIPFWPNHDPGLGLGGKLLNSIGARRQTRNLFTHQPIFVCVCGRWKLFMVVTVPEHFIGRR